MNETVRKLVEILFADVERTEEVQALYDEVLDNCSQRYEDMKARGCPEDEAVSAVAESLSGMEEVLAAYPRRMEAPKEESQEGVLTWDVPEILQVTLFGGDLRVECTEGSQAEVEPCENTEVAMEGGRLTIRENRGTRLREFTLGRGALRVSMQADENADTGSFRGLLSAIGSALQRSFSEGRTVVRLPASWKGRAQISTASGDVEWDGPNAAELRIDTRSGDLDVSTAEEGCILTAVMETASGDIEAKGTYAECSMKTMSGDIDWQGSARDLTVSSISGDITLGGCVVRGKTKTVSGDIDAAVGAELRAFTAATTSGDIDIRSGDPLRAELKLHTVSGEIIQGDCQSWPGADTVLDLQTVSGDIGLHI